MDNYTAPDVTREGLREGIKINKGYQLTTEYIAANQSQFGALMTYWTAYPDMFLDLISSETSGFHFYFYQRIMLRAMMRYKSVYFTAARSTSKSFIAIIALFLQCVFMPGRHCFITANTKEQATKIAKSKLMELFNHWPILKKEIVGWQLAGDDAPGNYGKDYIVLKFNNGSQFDVVLAGDSSRGIRANGCFIDEARDADEVALNEIILPTLTVSRHLPDGSQNEREPNQQRLVATSAGGKSTFAYQMMLDMFENSIIDPENFFVAGLDYRIPVAHGLISKQYINQLKMSKSYNPESFAREFMLLMNS